MDKTERGNPFNPRRVVAKLLDGVGETKDGETFDVSAMRLASVQVKGISTATVKWEGTLDDINFVQVGSDISSDGIIQISGYYKGIRANVTAYTSGDITVLYAGRM